jgi:hypothetical protein
VATVNVLNDHSRWPERERDIDKLLIEAQLERIQEVTRERDEATDLATARGPKMAMWQERAMAVDCERDEARAARGGGDRQRSCTCLGSCKGADDLAEGWICVLDPAHY